MRALVTGFSGFVGQHLARHLAESGDELCGIVRPGAPPGAVAATLLPADIRDGSAVIAAIRALAPNTIYHLAGLTHVGDSWDRRRETLETNLFGALSVLEAARGLQPRPRVLVVGSAEQYGYTGRVARALDEDTPQVPVTPYGVSKAAQEMLGRQYAIADELPVVMVRSFNHTGPGQSPQFVIPSWAKQIAEMERGLRQPRLEVGNLESERDFTDVRDMVKLYRLLALKGRPGEAYNGCSGVVRSLREVVETFRKHARVNFEVVASGGSRQVDSRVLLGSAEKARREVGWKRDIPFEHTLLAVLDEWRAKVR